MSTPLNIAMLSRFVRDIKVRCSEEIDTLNQALPAMPRDNNETISRKEFSEAQWYGICETFGEFSKEIHSLSKHLARFAVDKEEGTITIIGNNNTTEVG